MAQFCIMRTKKLKADQNVGASVSHALRTRETLNADALKTPDNWCCWKGTNQEQRDRAMAEYRKRLPEKVRKNGVRAVELMMTASPEVFTRIKASEYLNACDEWAKKVFGASNIFLITHHYDETTPHTSILLVPIDPKGKLNCRHFLGERNKLSELQDSFAETVGKSFGLDRGVKGSKARHQTIKQFYGKVQALDKAITPPKKKLLESQVEYEERYKEQLAPVVKNALAANALKKQVDEYGKVHKQRLQAVKTAYQTQIAGLQSDLERKNEDNIKLRQEADYWRNLSPQELTRYARALEKEGVGSIKELGEKMRKEEQEKKRQKGGFSWDR
jgi:hypothetical protein